MRFIIEKHISSYHGYIVDVLLETEAISNARLYRWENEVTHAILNHHHLPHRFMVFHIQQGIHDRIPGLKTDFQLIKISAKL